MITYSFPCQDLSLQGSRKGLYDGQSSSMLWQVKRIISELREASTDKQKKNKLPKYLLLENVASLLHKENSKGFEEWLNYLEEIGYKHSVSSINSKYMGLPQNRNRAFVLSTLTNKEEDKIVIPDNKTDFTIKNITKKKISDYIDKKSERYDDELKFEMVGKMKLQNDEFILNGKTGIKKNRLINYTSYESENMVYSLDSISPTITATGALNRVKVYDEGRIRILNSSELWKLMGFEREDWERAKSLKGDDGRQLIPTTLLRKQAGNSIAVPVLMEIFKLIKEKENGK